MTTSTDPTTTGTIDVMPILESALTTLNQLLDTVTALQDRIKRLEDAIGITSEKP